MKLREYQENGVASVFDALIEGYRSVLLTAATGTGKTVMFSEITRHFLDAYCWKVLILVPTRELSEQAYMKIRDNCKLYDGIDIDLEMGASRFSNSARVVVGTWQTCSRSNRLQQWVPDAIIIDEAHQASCASYQEIFDRFPGAIRVGVTATAIRGDNRPVFEEHIDGTPFEVIDPNSGKRRGVSPGEAPFAKHVYTYELLDAISHGWLVDPIGYIIRSDLDISGVKSAQNATGDSDFVQKQLIDKLEVNDKTIIERINRAISVWSKFSPGDPTLVFCPSVKYAKWAAKLWQQAGWTAQAIDAKTDELTRSKALDNVRKGRVVVTCNYGVYTHGTDVSEWSSLVLMRPTTSQGLYMQMLGRGTRPSGRIAHKLGELPTAGERVELIASSDKPHVKIFDVVDVCGKHAVQTLPSSLGVPRIDLQGKSVREAKTLIEKCRENADILDEAECPQNFEELSSVVDRIDLLGGGRVDRGDWTINAQGDYHFRHTPPGYVGKLQRDLQNDTWVLTVVHGATGEVVRSKEVPHGQYPVSNYFKSSASAVRRAVKEHQDKQPKPPNWERLENKDRFYACKMAGFSARELNAMPWENVQNIIRRERTNYWVRKSTGRGEEHDVPNV